MKISGAAIKVDLTSKAKDLGFAALEVSSVPVDLRQDYYREWIASGQHGGMDWMERNNDRRLQPEALIPEARSIVVVSLNYYQPDPQRGFRIAKYALGDDYHNLILKRLKQLCRVMREEYGGVQRPYVDTGPVLEKPIAAAAGLGWQGKSTILIEPKRGTWSFLGTIVTTLDLPSGQAVKDRCGSCTRCIEVCPTQAITAPYQLDARRCIAYLTIEHDGAIPLEFRESVGDRLFGCDECLDVCPWNRWAVVTKEARFAPRDLPLMREMLRWEECEFSERFRGSPMRRLKLQRFKRNICVVLGNVGTGMDVPALKAVAQGKDALLAEHASWALERIQSRSDA
ncbi:MAG: Epoxyqueuosine reductase [Opitutia bacterium UBA7350]|nr:MAG: Epoxyqueuosine reductase [Opitutae bacterium UBA7350]